MCGCAVGENLYSCATLAFPTTERFPIQLLLCRVPLAVYIRRKLCNTLVHSDVAFVISLTCNQQRLPVSTCLCLCVTHSLSFYLFLSFDRGYTGCCFYPCKEISALLAWRCSSSARIVYLARCAARAVEPFPLAREREREKLVLVPHVTCYKSSVMLLSPMNNRRAVLIQLFVAIVFNSCVGN